MNLVESLRMEASTCLLAAKAPGGGPLWRDGMWLLGKKLEAAADRIATLEAALRAMFKADDDYGCGFYNQESWLKPYDQLREMVIPPAEHSVTDSIDVPPPCDTAETEGK